MYGSNCEAPLLTVGVIEMVKSSIPLLDPSSAKLLGKFLKPTCRYQDLSNVYMSPDEKRIPCVLGGNGILSTKVKSEVNSAFSFYVWDANKNSAKSIDPSASCAWQFMNHPKIKPSLHIGWLIATFRPFLAEIVKHNSNMSCTKSSQNFTIWKSLLSFVPHIRAIDAMNIFTDDPDLLNFGARGAPLQPSRDLSFQRQGDKDSILHYCSEVDKFVPLLNLLCETLGNDNIKDTFIGDPKMCYMVHPA